MASAGTFLSGEGSLHLLLFRKPSQPNSPGHPALLCFRFGSWLGFKPPNLKGAATSGLEVCSALTSAFCPRKIVPHLHSVWNRWHVPVKSTDQVINALVFPLSPADERSFAGTCRVFCPWKGNIPSSKRTAGRGMMSPSATSEIPTPNSGIRWYLWVILKSKSFRLWKDFLEIMLSSISDMRRTSYS